jgi:hypothetical protein
VPEYLKISSFSFTALKKAVDNQSNWLSTTGQHAPLSRFITDDMHQKMLDNEHRYDREREMTLMSLKRKDDKFIIRVFAHYVRTKYMYSEKTCGEHLYYAVPLLRPEGKNPNAPLKIEDYDKLFHARMAKHISILRANLEFMYVDENTAETKNWPEPGYQKGNRHGMTQILMETLGIYKENYMQCIGEEKFKKIETPVALLEEWNDINNRLARFAIQHRDEESRLEARTNLKDLVAGVEARRSRYTKSVLTSEGPRHRDLPSTPAYSSKSRYPDREQTRTPTVA